MQLQHDDGPYKGRYVQGCTLLYVSGSNAQSEIFFGKSKFENSKNVKSRKGKIAKIEITKSKTL